MINPGNCVIMSGRFTNKPTIRRKEEDGEVQSVSFIIGLRRPYKNKKMVEAGEENPYQWDNHLCVHKFPYDWQVKMYEKADKGDLISIAASLYNTTVKEETKERREGGRTVVEHTRSFGYLLSVENIDFKKPVDAAVAEELEKLREEKKALEEENQILKKGIKAGAAFSASSISAKPAAQPAQPAAQPADQTDDQEDEEDESVGLLNFDNLESLINV